MGIYLNKDVEKASAVSGVWTLTLANVDGIKVGEKISIYGVTANANINNATVTAVSTTNLTVTYSHGNTTIAQFDTDGIVHIVCNWVDAAYVEDMLGFVPTGDDLVFLQECVDAGNDWAFRKRRESGYNDLPYANPGADVRLGTGLYAMSLYRERGAAEGFASYETMGIVPQPTGGLGRIMQLLGCTRPQVA